jgi:hypothetical protein
MVTDGITVLQIPCSREGGASQSEKWGCLHLQRTVTSMPKGEPGSVSPSLAPTTVSWYLPAFVALYLAAQVAEHRQVVASKRDSCGVSTSTARLTGSKGVSAAMVTACIRWPQRTSYLYATLGT